jgi:hypothetical protein
MVAASDGTDNYEEYTDEEFDALPPLEKWDVLVQEKREVEADLGSLNATRFREEQALIRQKRLPEKVSRDAWLKRRRALTQHREELLVRKVEVESLMQELRPVVDELKARRREALASDVGVVSELRRLADVVADLSSEIKLLRRETSSGGENDQDPAATSIAG